MPAVIAERTINAPKDQVWDVMADFPTAANYHPGVVKSFNINDTPRRGLGAERTCEFNANGSNNVQERIVRYEEGSSFDVVIYGGTQLPPVNDMLATIAVHPANDNQTILRATITYKLKKNPILWLMGRTIVRRLMQNVFDDIVDGAKYHIETGNTVTNTKTLRQALASA